MKTEISKMEIMSNGEYINKINKDNESNINT